MPSKKEILLLQYLNKVNTRYDNGKKGDTEKNIKNNLPITDDDINDMHWSNLLYFSSSNKEPVICISYEGDIFIKNYCYEKIKEIFYWIFGISSIIAAVFAVLAFLK